MWPKSYRDYPEDTSLKKEVVEPCHGIIGCEMHDLNGWGLSYHVPQTLKKGPIANFWGYLRHFFKSDQH